MTTPDYTEFAAVAADANVRGIMVSAAGVKKLDSLLADHFAGGGKMVAAQIDTPSELREAIARALQDELNPGFGISDVAYRQADAILALTTGRARAKRNPSDRENWLIECLRYSIQFHIWADATREQVAEVIEHINEMSCWDDHAAALVQVPRGISHQEAQEAVDRALATTPADPREKLEADLVEARADVALWKREAADRSEGMVQLNLDRAAMGVAILQLRECVQSLIAIRPSNWTDDPEDAAVWSAAETVLRETSRL